MREECINTPSLKNATLFIRKTQLAPAPNEQQFYYELLYVAH